MLKLFRRLKGVLRVGHEGGEVEVVNGKDNIGGQLALTSKSRAQSAVFEESRR